MTNTAATGFVPTAATSAGQVGERKFDVSSEVMLLAPFNYPMIGLLTNIGKVSDGVGGYKGYSKKKRAVKDPVFYVFEDAYGTTYELLADGPAIADTTITVADAYIYAEQDIILLVDPAGAIENEQILITAITDSTTITITRGFDEDNAGTGLGFNGGACQMFLLGSANAEGATSRTPVNTTKTKVYNYTQIFRTPFEVTGTLNSTEMHTGNQLQYQRFKQGVEHALDIERSFWFGKKQEDTTGATPIRATGGLIEFIEATGSGAFEQDESSSVLTETEFNTFLEGGFGYGSTEKLLFSSGRILSQIADFARGAVRIAPKDRTFGVKIQQYESPHGSVNIVRNPLFVNNFAGTAALVDLDSVEYVHLNGRDTTLRENIQANDKDSIKHEFFSEVGLGRYNAQKCAILKGVSAS